MNTALDRLEPAGLWRHFFDLSRIPRPSHHESQIQQHLQRFAEGLGLEHLKDRAGNVIIRKPAHPSRERGRGVILQGHMDMVPQANSDSSHDFRRDPIECWIDGSWVRARGTTLGADNGIGVAAAMAVLASNSLRHGPIEALFTCNEEDGMSGAFGLAPDLLKGEVLINTDSEQEGELCIGCAGGANFTARLATEWQPATAGNMAVEIFVQGLRGGHSGVDIHRGRGNANLLLGALLLEAAGKVDMALSRFDGGNMRNAIPREASALVTLPEAQLGLLQQLAERYQQRIKMALGEGDPGLSIRLERVSLPERRLASPVQKNLLKALENIPNGVLAMSETMPGLVETSSNLAIVKSETECIELQALVRSSSDAQRAHHCRALGRMFAAIGAETRVEGAYPGWQPDPRSKLLATSRQVYRSLFGAEVRVGAMHAGLECGILGAAYPRLEMISFGPTIRYPHSPDERVEIGSVARFWSLLCGVLEALA